MTLANIQALHDAIAAVCPIKGISVGDPATKATWRIDFDSAATAQQQAAAQTVVDGWDSNAPTADETRASAFLSDTDRQTIIAQVANATPAQIKTYINNNVTDLASAKLMLIRLALLVSLTIRS